MRLLPGGTYQRSIMGRVKAEAQALAVRAAVGAETDLSNNGNTNTGEIGGFTVGGGVTYYSQLDIDNAEGFVLAP